MAVVRNTIDSQSAVSYVSTLAFLCCVSCVVIMLKFRAFRAKINVASKRSKDEDVPVVCISGAYRSNREEFFESGRFADPPKKITPSMVKLPPNKNASIRPSKSTSDIREPEFVPVMLNKSTPEISFDPRGGKNNIPEVELRHPEKSLKVLKKEEKEKIKLEKKRQAEQKAREKAAQEQEKKETAKREKEQAKQAKARDKNNKKNKAAAPQAPPLPSSPPPQTSTELTPPTRQPNRQPLAPSNSFLSDINRNSGPPPYSEQPEPINKTKPASKLPEPANKLPQPTSKPSQPVNKLPEPVNRQRKPASKLPEPVKGQPAPASNMPETINKLPGQAVNFQKANTNNVSFGKPIDNTPSSWDMVTQHRQQMSRPTATVGGARKLMVMDLQYNFNNTANDRNNSEA